MQKSASLIKKYTLEKYGGSTSQIVQQMLTCEQNIASCYKDMQERLCELVTSTRTQLRCNKYKLRKIGLMNALLEALT